MVLIAAVLLINVHRTTTAFTEACFPPSTMNTEKKKWSHTILIEKFECVPKTVQDSGIRSSVLKARLGFVGELEEKH